MKPRRLKLLMVGVIVAEILFPATIKADSLTYYPEGGTMPFVWSTVANWYATPSAYNVLPSIAEGAIPTFADDVVINAWGYVSGTSPVVIGDGETVTVANLYLARNAGKKPYYDAGAALCVNGGALDVLGNLVSCPDVYSYATLSLQNGACVNVLGNAMFGENNFTTIGYCRTDIDATSELNVSGSMTVGRRSANIETVVTNRGALSAGSLQIGPANENYIGTGVVHNVGRLYVTGNLDVGGIGKGNGKGGSVNDDIRSCGRLVLAEGSSLSLGETAHIYVGGNSDSTYGDGILDTSIPIILTNAQGISIGNACSNAVEGGVLILRQNARLDVGTALIDIGHRPHGKAALKMYDTASVTNAAKIRLSDPNGVVSALELHGHAMITNVSTVRIGETTKACSGAHGRIELDGDSSICFVPTAFSGEGSGFILGATSDNRADVIVRDRARIYGLYRVSASASASGYNAFFRIEGGSIVFAPQEKTSRLSFQLGNSSYNAVDGVGRICGYGAISRTDAAAPDSSRYMSIDLRMHDWSVTADGCGVMRDLDMRAFTYVNFDVANIGNLSGSNGWYAVNGGRLLFPRADKVVGRSAANPACHFGDWRYQGTNALGKAIAPTLVNAFSLEPTTDVTGGRAYCHAALYAPGRSDIPVGMTCEDGRKVVSVWRIGTCTSGWTADDPTTPWTAWTAMKVTFCYDQKEFGGALPAVLYRYDGVKWRRVASLSNPTAETTISATVSPLVGTYDVGWFALVEEVPRNGGMSIVIR